MGMDERKYRILQAIIDDYILTAEPVGSRTISRKYDMGLSSAPVRSDRLLMSLSKHTLPAECTRWRM